MKIMKPPVFDKHLHLQLIGILELAMQPTKGSARRNDAACARILGINVRTYDRVASGLDDWPWWPAVVQAALLEVVPHVEYWKRQLIAKRLRALPERVAHPIEEASAARDWLIEQLKDGPARASELLTTANRGRLHEKAIRRAAHRLGVIKTRKGNKKDHEVTWELPKGD